IKTLFCRWTTLREVADLLMENVSVLLAAAVPCYSLACATRTRPSSEPVARCLQAPAPCPVTWSTQLAAARLLLAQADDVPFYKTMVHACACWSCPTKAAATLCRCLLFRVVCAVEAADFAATRHQAAIQRVHRGQSGRCRRGPEERRALISQ